jgi:hypothetical protein
MDVFKRVFLFEQTNADLDQPFGDNAVTCVPPVQCKDNEMLVLKHDWGIRQPPAIILMEAQYSRRGKLLETASAEIMQGVVTSSALPFHEVYKGKTTRKWLRIQSMIRVKALSSGSMTRFHWERAVMTLSLGEGGDGTFPRFVGNRCTPILGREVAL